MIHGGSSGVHCSNASKMAFVGVVKSQSQQVAGCRNVSGKSNKSGPKSG